jgi:hypothetical protein
MLTSLPASYAISTKFLDFKPASIVSRYWTSFKKQNVTPALIVSLFPDVTTPLATGICTCPIRYSGKHSHVIEDS